MKFTAEQIAEILQGEIVGNPNVEVSSLSKIEEGQEGSLTFLSNPKYQNFIYTTQASVTIVNSTFVPDASVSTTMIKVADAYGAFTKLLEFYNQVKLNKTGIESLSFIDESVTYESDLYLGNFGYVGKNVVLGKNVKIYPNSYVGDNTVIGDNVTIFAGVTIYSETVIGTNCTIHSGSIIGSDGFGFAPNTDGTYTKIPQIGNVVIEDNVEIGANTTIDRATMGSTFIRKGVKLDNQIQVGHNVEIGDNTVIAAQTGIAGSTKIGKNGMIGGQVGFAGHITVGDNVKIKAKSGISKNVKDGEVLQGPMAFNDTNYSKSYIHFKNLPKIISEIEELKKEILNLKKNNNG